ncbi:MAG: hypothetical protein R3A52_10800 [Polyangiales bacterium]
MRHALLLGLALAAGCASTQRPTRPRGPATAADFFPLRRGAAWSFDTDTHFGGDTTLSVLSVVEANPPEFSVRSGRRVERYELRADGVVREGEYLLHDPIRQGATWEGRQGSRYEVVSVNQRRTVGEQSFDEVVEVRKSTPGTRIETTTWYARGVGPIEIVASTTSSIGGAINVRSTLRGYSLGDEAPRSE